VGEGAATSRGDAGPDAGLAGTGSAPAMPDAHEAAKPTHMAIDIGLMSDGQAKVVPDQ